MRVRDFRVRLEGAGHVQRSAEYLGSLVPAVLDALYDHLLSLPETRGFFETQDIQYLKPYLVSWITRTIEVPHDGDYWGYPERVGKVHRDYGVPYYEMVHLIGWVQVTIALALLDSDRPEKQTETGAWTKLLTAQLGPMLSS